jgi:hypothetical protein
MRSWLMGLGVKNSNKKSMLYGAERRAWYASKKKLDELKSRGKWKTQRYELKKYDGQTVEFNGTIWMNIKGLSRRPLLLGNVLIGDVLVDHVWVELSVRDWDRLQFGYRWCRVYMIGVVKMYSKLAHGCRSAYGLEMVKLCGA